MDHLVKDAHSQSVIEGELQRMNLHGSTSLFIVILTRQASTEQLLHKRLSDVRNEAAYHRNS